jgi:hypothetical protein
MRRAVPLLCLLALGVSASATFGQSQKAVATRLPVQLSPSFFQSLNTKPKQTRVNKMSAAANAASTQQPQRIITVPTFTKSFTFAGVTYPYTMMGHKPEAGGTTEIPTTYVPMSFFFDEFVDQNGNNITIDATAINDEIRHSPNFDDFGYGSGFTQFGDAIQRAEFFSVIGKNKGGGGNDGGDNDGPWHTLLGRPQILIPVQIEVPVGSSIVFQAPDGSLGALIDINFLGSQLNTLLQTEGVNVREFPIFLSRNAVYGDFSAGQPQDCCIGGFHGGFEVNQVGNNIFVQTFAFATSLDGDIADFVFGDPALFSDVNALSHEISESMNDPFGNNATPNYQLPGLPPGVCQANLETGDAIENLQPDYFPVTLHGFTYHPQTEALLQWFEGKSPSDAIDGAYSYPDETKLIAPFMPCPTQ